MKIEFVNPFLVAAPEVLQSEVGAGVRRGRMSVVEGSYVSGDVTIVVGLIGQVEGGVL